VIYVEVGIAGQIDRTFPSLSLDVERLWR
jgi:hypothetical protein